MSLKIFLVVAFVSIVAATKTKSDDVGETEGLVRAVRQVEAGSLYGNAIAAPGVAPQYTIVQLSANSGTGRQQGSGLFGSPTRLGGVRGFSSRGASDGVNIADDGGQPQLIVVANPVASGNDEGNRGGYYVPSYSPIQSGGPVLPRFSSRQPAGPAAPMSAPAGLAGFAPGTYMTGQPAGRVVPDFRPMQAAGPAAYSFGQSAGQAVRDSRPIQAGGPATSNYWAGQPAGPAIPNLAPVQAPPSAPANYFTGRSANYFTGQSAAQPISNYPSARAAAGPAFANYFTGQQTGQSAAPNVVPSGPASPNEAAFNYIPNRSAGPTPIDYYNAQPTGQAASGFTSGQSSGQFPRFANPGSAPSSALSQPLWSNSANVGRSRPNQASGFGVYPANPGYPGYPAYPINPASPGYPINSASSGYPINSGSLGYPINSGSSGYPINSGSSGYPINSGSPGYPINSGPSGYPMNSGSLGYPEDSGSSGWKSKPCMGKILSHCPTCGSSKF